MAIITQIRLINEQGMDLGVVAEGKDAARATQTLTRDTLNTIGVGDSLVYNEWDTVRGCDPRIGETEYLGEVDHSAVDYTTFTDPETI